MTTYHFPVIQGEETGKRLRELRKNRGFKVAAICDYMGGISEQAVYKWERGACLPTIDNLLALSHLYHVKIEDLLVYQEVETASYSFAEKNCSGSPQVFYEGSGTVFSVFMHVQQHNGGCLTFAAYAQAE